MARRSRSKSFNRPQGRRVNISPITLTPLRLHPLPPRLVSRPILDDRRTFHPNRFIRPAVSVGKRADTKLVVHSDPLKKVQRLTPQVAFAKPRKVLICVRRARRKEVLMAKGVGGSRVRKPRRNQFSDVRC